MCKVIIAKYTINEKFIIPHHIDLDNKEQVECYWVKYNVLHVILKNVEKVLKIKGQGWIDSFDYEHPDEDPIIQDDSDDDDDDDDDDDNSDNNFDNDDNVHGEHDDVKVDDAKVDDAKVDEKKEVKSKYKEEIDKNRRKVISITYTVREKFIIPEYIDLEQVSEYYVHYNVLHIWLKNKEPMSIDTTSTIDIPGNGWVEDFDFKYPDKDPKPQYDSDEDENENEDEDDDSDDDSDDDE